MNLIVLMSPLEYDIFSLVCAGTEVVGKAGHVSLEFGIFTYTCAVFHMSMWQSLVFFDSSLLAC
jgi:hypothetical protein